MKPTIKPERTDEQRAEEEAIRHRHEANPIRQRPVGAVSQQSFATALRLAARLKAAQESQGLTLAEVAERMQMDEPALARMEAGNLLNPTLSTLLRCAEVLGHRLELELVSE